MRATAVILLAALLAGCGASPAEEQTPVEQPAPSPTLPSQRETPPGSGPAAVPHREEAPPRTGEVRTKTAHCVMDAEPAWSFDGTVTAIEGGEVAFEVHETFGDGDLPAERTVRMGAPVTPTHSEAAPSYSVGTRLLVTGSGAQAWGCGGTLYYDEETAAAWRS
ncbi:hypothetical protein [Nocardioides aestuarii]|uniref:Uncharacterized protein n=1 Tax=Nocardioides aestuarii TaxID=252231 RepID=A0ABW4TQC1_9ACTN